MDSQKYKKKFQKKNLSGICKNKHCCACSKFLKFANNCKVVLSNTNEDRNEDRNEEKKIIDNNFKEYLCPNTLNEALNNININ